VVPDDANKIVHLAFTMFGMIRNMIWILVRVHNKKKSFNSNVLA